MEKIKFITDIKNYSSNFYCFVDELLTCLYSTVYDSNENHVMLDVGANKGDITKILLAHTNEFSGEIIAIDAHPNWSDDFLFNDHPLVTKYNTGCYSTKCVKKFIAQKNLTGKGFIGLSPVKHKLDIKKLVTFKIDCDTLDNIINTNKKISFLKIDAESSDFEILLGGINLIKNHRPFILFEFSGQIFEKAHAHDRKDFFKFFKDINYNLYSAGLGLTADQIADSWDKFMPEFTDILAIPQEHKGLAE